MPVGRFGAPDVILVNGVSAIDVPVGHNLTLTWSEGKSETYSGVTIPESKYLIYKTDTASTPLSGTPVATLDYTADRSYTIAGPTSVGQTCYYWVALQEPANYTGAKYFNTTPATATGVTVTANGPVTLSISNSVVVAGASATLSWTASTPGTNSVVSNYRVQRSTNGSSWSNLKTQTGRTLTVTAPTTSGSTYYYRVYALGEWTESTSIASNTVSLLANTPPEAPTVTTSGKTYNPKPRVLVTIGYDSDAVSIAASGFTASRSTNISYTQNVDLRKSSNASTGNGSVTITVTDPYGATATATATWNYTAPTWTDNPIVAGTTLVKAVHIMELRSAFDDICDYYGLTRTAWGDDVVAGVTSSALWPTHATQLQNTATRIAQYINMFDSLSSTNNVVLPSFTDASAARAAVINELRQAVTLL